MNKSLSLGAITVAGAEMLRVQLNAQGLPEDAELFIGVKPGDELVHWDFDRLQNLWSPVIFGDTVQIAIRSSQELSDVPILGVLQLFPLSAGGMLVRGEEVFVDGQWTVLASKVDMGPLVDSSCKADENTRYRNLPNFVRQMESATGLLATVTKLSSGLIVAGFCTGTRLRSTTDPLGYYILTANHCFTPGDPPQSNATPASVASTQIFWDYKTSACNAAGPVQYFGPQLSALPSSSSATLLGARFQSDAVLFRVTPVAGARAALGWQIGLQFTNDAFVHRVSHPYSFSAAYTLQLIDHIENRGYCEAEGMPRVEYFNSGLLEGATAPGSSGSAVVTQNLRVVGQQYGICKMTINGYTWHYHVDGELSRSWPAFGVFLQ
ncbi:hypothetical protein [Comamonas thiooxydans]|uniref:hypothetical protein n=1 Tax=Comamonas thiooxydans TaxID=363952 RepID=UPI002114C6D7|nr:hypothetical protein [Comamonas thiooxydans]UUE94834.1 hypothetical protein MJ608_04025 [Comamonas thiooxydans]